MKIHIIGGSGTGKTYFAEAISRQSGISHYDLDNLQWDAAADTYGTKRPEESRDAMLADILKNESWIIEGVYYQWCSQCFEKADRIYVLELPEYVCDFRIIKRFVKRKLGMEKGKKETLSSLYHLLVWTHKFQKKNLPEIKRIIARHGGKVIYIKSEREVRRLIQNRKYM